jgi:hypothetical protein
MLYNDSEKKVIESIVTGDKAIGFTPQNHDSLPKRESMEWHSFGLTLHRKTKVTKS